VIDHRGGGDGPSAPVRELGSRGSTGASPGLDRGSPGGLPALAVVRTGLAWAWPGRSPGQAGLPVGWAAFFPGFHGVRKGLTPGSTRAILAPLPGYGPVEGHQGAGGVQASPGCPGGRRGSRGVSNRDYRRKKTLDSPAPPCEYGHSSRVRPGEGLREYRGGGPRGRSRVRASTRTRL
jgi:hypothetical protein